MRHPPPDPLTGDGSIARYGWVWELVEAWGPPSLAPQAAATVSLPFELASATEARMCITEELLV